MSISHLAWGEIFDEEMYLFLNQIGFGAIEIAPTRLFPENPYGNQLKAKKFARKLEKNYHLEISSMQSIWFGKSENLFGDEIERKALLEYTKHAIDFASAIRCGNLVFGSPKNRILKDKSQFNMAIQFFREVGQYALSKKTVFSIEPNPPIYGTNFINTTKDGVEIVKEVGHDGFRLNLDIGTVIYYKESLDFIAKHISMINHIHISEPNLMPIIKRKTHDELAEILRENDYKKYISIEMRDGLMIGEIKQCITYVKEVFNVV